MFNMLGGLGGFAGGFPAMSSLGFGQSIPTPAFGDYMNLNNMFQISVGPSGLMGMGGLNASVSGAYSGMVGGDLTGLTQARVPQYRTVIDQKPVYAYDIHAVS